MKKKIYVVTNGTFSDYRIIGVYSNIKLAEEMRDKQKRIRDDGCKIETWPLDENKEVLFYWRASVEPVTGEINEISSLKIWEDEKEDLSSWRQNYTSVDDVKDQIFAGVMFEERRLNLFIGEHITVCSDKSQEHANKLAAEARQEFLRLMNLYRYEIQLYCKGPSYELIPLERKENVANKSG